MWTAAFTSNHPQVQLDQSYSDISHLRIWGGLTTVTQTCSFLTVWLSSGTNYTAGTVCARYVSALSGQEHTVTCSHVSALDTRYVTLEHNEPTSNDVLVIHELYIFRSGECCGVGTVVAVNTCAYACWLSAQRGWRRLCMLCIAYR